MNAQGAHLYDSGLRHARIVVLGENSYEWILTWFAAVLGGNIIVPLDKDQRPEEIAGLLKRCGAELFVCSRTYYDLAEHVRDAGAVHNILRRILTWMVETSNNPYAE